MAGMLIMASRNLSRRMLRAAKNVLDGRILVMPVKYRQYHIRVKSFQKLSTKVLCENRTNSIRTRQFHSSPTLFEVKTVKVPAFADSVSEGDVKWQKKKGDHVAQDEVVAEVETDKTAVPVPAPGHGIIVETLAAEGATVKAGQDLYKIDITGQLPPGGGAKKAAPAAAPKAAQPPKAAPSPPATAAPRPPSRPAAAAPTPRPAAAAPPPRPAGGAPMPPVSPSAAAVIKMPPKDPTKEIAGTRSEHRVKMNRMRMRIAERLKQAQNVTAMLTTFNEIDMSYIMDWRKSILKAFTEKHGLKVGFMSVFCKASAYALLQQPVVNAVIDGKEIIYRDYVDISVAVATPKGLVVPVVRNVEQMSYADIEKEMASLADKARKNKLAVEDMDGGTFTISNGGVFGSLLGTPIINPPQSSILGMHGIFDRPVAIKKKVVIRPMMYIALTYDHRLIDGREAVMFLRKIKEAVEDPRVILAGM